jgi:gliding motility-associated-like protein
MKAKIYLFLFLNIFVSVIGFSQNTKQTQQDTGFFNYAYWNGYADKLHLKGEERAEIINGQKLLYIEELNHQHIDHKDYVWVTEPQKKGYSSNATAAGPCTNIDFEQGTIAGWTVSAGWNPIVNTSGCCSTTNTADYAIVTGAGIDPFGGFPVVYPGGGSFSLKLGSTAVGGKADRIEQNFFVTAANANFTYRYAVVLDDPNHPLVEQPYFTSEIIDTLGNIIPCTIYTVSAGAGIPGFTTTVTGGQTIRSKAWTDVAIDLTPNIGRNVKIRFTVYDCSRTGHFAYAYIDGVCTNFQTSTADTTCPNIPVAMCAPAGFASTTWNGPGVVSNTTQCILVAAPGVYSCTTLLGPGCPGPTFMHTLTVRDAPALTFTPITTGVCASQYTMNSTMGINSGSISSHVWEFGDGSTSSAINPIHNYALPGTYAIKLKGTSNLGCMDSVTNFITIFPTPNLVFSPPSNCINTVVQFTNSSSISVGTISGYTWTLGNGANSNLINPTNTYTANGTYTITLTGISNQGCLATLTQTLGIFSPPIISFTATPLCDINGTSFSSINTNSAVSGPLANFIWDFGDSGTSTQSNPVHIYALPGPYTVNFNAVSIHNCPAVTSNSFLISPSPTMAFATTSINACSPNFTFTNNSGISVGPLTHTWTFKSTTGTTVTPAYSPSFIFPSIGDYTVMLVGTSNMGCQDTALQRISVYPYPVVNFSVPASCESAIFAVNTTAISGSVTSYNWNFGDPASGAANTSTLQNPTHFYSTTNNYNITLNIISNLNCASSNVFSLTVFPNPVAAFTYTTLDFCSLPYTFVNTSSVSNIGASTIVSNNWVIGNVSSSQANPGTVNFPSNGNYPVSLIVTTNHNCSDTLISNILVHPLPQLDFTLTPSCLNVPVNIQSTASISPVPSATSNVASYSWDFGDATFSTSLTPLPHNYTASGIKTVNFSATSNMGCSSNLTKTVEVYPIPTVTFTSSDSTCIGNAKQFISTHSIASGTVFSLNWDFGDGTIGSNQTTSHTYSTSGDFVVTFSATTNHECVSTLIKNVTVHPLPLVSYTANGGCLNLPSQFTETASIVQTSTLIPSSVASYSWNFGDGNFSGSQNPQYTYTLAGTYTPTHTAFSNFGCAQTATNTVIINPLPVIAFNPPSACVNVSIQFANTSSISTGVINSYTWNFGGGITSNLTNPVNSYAVFGVKTVSLSATSDLGCITTTVNNLTINPNPVLAVTPLSNSCVNDSIGINLNMGISGGVSAIQSYTLNFGDGSNYASNNIPSSYLRNHKYTTYNTNVNPINPHYTITLNAISSAGCLSSKDTIITIYPKPFPNFIANNFCYGSLTAFTNSTTIPSPYSVAKHEWDFGDNTPISLLQDPTHAFVGTSNTFSTYPVSLTETSYPEGLSGPVSCKQTAVKTITIYPHPVAAFSANSVCLGNPTSFTNQTPTLNVNGWSWYQYNNQTLTSLAQNPSLTFSASGTFTTKLIALNTFGCTDTTTRQVKVYENPVSKYTTNNHCLGLPSIFTHTTTFADGNELLYVWTMGTSTLATQPAPAPGLAFTFTAPGTYSVSLTSFSDLGCSNKYTSTVTVYPLPQTSFFAPESCLRQSTPFTNLSFGSNNTYNWVFGDPNSGSANTSTALNPTHTYTNSGSYNVTLTATTDKNCTASTSTNVLIHGIPSANFTNPTICADDKVAFTNLSTSGDGTIKDNQWDFNGDNLFDKNEPNPIYTYSLGGNYFVKLVVTSEFGCSDTAAKLILANPKAIGAITSNKNSGCPGVCINFKDNSTISNGTYTATWDFNDGEPETQGYNASRCYDKTGNFDVTLTLTSDIGCVNKLVFPAYVKVFPAPQAAFKVEPEEIDEDEPVITVSNQSSSDVNFIRYYINDGSSFGSPNFTHYIKNLKQTKPMVVQIVKNQFGCVDTIYQLINIKPAYVVYFPNVFTPNGDGTNDDFRPKGVGISKFTMNIYDRWGHQVFQTNDITQTWDGQIKNGDGAIKEDTYTWKAQVTDVFNKNHYLVGHVTVIR